MTATAWILIGVAVAVSIAFPVALMAIAKIMSGGSPSPHDDGDS